MKTTKGWQHNNNNNKNLYWIKRWEIIYDTAHDCFVIGCKIRKIKTVKTKEQRWQTPRMNTTDIANEREKQVNKIQKKKKKLITHRRIDRNECFDRFVVGIVRYFHKETILRGNITRRKILRCVLPITSDFICSGGRFADRFISHSLPLHFYITPNRIGSDRMGWDGMGSDV